MNSASTMILENFIKKWENHLSQRKDAALYSIGDDDLMHMARIFPMNTSLGKTQHSDDSAQISNNVLKVINQAMESISANPQQFEENLREANNPAVQEVALYPYDTQPKQNRLGIFYILVPPSISAPINMTNISHFLEKGEFRVPTAATFARRSREIELSPESLVGPSTHSIKAVDDPSLVPENAWDNILASIVIGKEWQFEGWFGKSGEQRLPVSSILNRIPSFYVSFHGENVPKSILRWNTTVVQIDKSKKDVFTARQMWEKILANMAMKQQS